MTDIKRYESVTPQGIYDFVCPHCGYRGKTSNLELVYCSAQCAKRAYSRRHYLKHRDREKALHLAHIRQKRKEAKSKKH
jgi:hypothetical protein